MTKTYKGLTSEEVQLRLSQNGKNKLLTSKKKGFLSKVFLAMCDRMTLILLAAAVISGALSFFGEGSKFDPLIILAIVLANAFVSAAQETRAEKALSALNNLSPPRAVVIRNREKTEILSEDVVVNDIIVLEKGFIVPADAKLLYTEALTVDESMLTGESEGVLKDENAVVPANAHKSDCKNLVFSGSSVVGGRGVAEVFATGMNSYIGSIAQMLAVKEEKTPLQKRLEKLSALLGNLTIIICLLIFLLSLIKGMPIGEMFLTGVSLAVAAIPEGLPATVTAVLSIGVVRMAKHKAVVKKLPAVETLGCTTVICTDKTGTITENKMTVVKHFGNEMLSTACILCNDVASPTEEALFEFAKREIENPLEVIEKYPRVRTLPFESARRLMATAHQYKNRFIIIIKGAPEVLLPLCENDENVRKTAISMSENALRVIAFAYREAYAINGSLANGRFSFIGLCGISDPPRPEVAEAVKICREAGIKPVMITGDSPGTAKAVALQTGILKENGLCRTEAELSNLSDSELAKEVRNVCVFARTTPAFKVRIVDAFLRNGNIVAMTGDGVNDAPALKRADIGCAMGRGGTEVARQAADIILTDDNFATVVEAVKCGRGIYENIRRVIHFLLSCNIGEIITVALAILFSLPSPLAAVQLLWVNLVTDSLPALALGLEKAPGTVMRRPPAMPRDSLFSGGLGIKIFLEGLLIGALSLAAFAIGSSRSGFLCGSTMCFCVLSMSQLFHSFNMRSSFPFLKEKRGFNGYLLLSFVIGMLLQTAVTFIPALAKVFQTTPLDSFCFACVLALSVAPILFCELYKTVWHKVTNNGN